MSKWEEMYKKYNDGKIDKIIEDLKKNGLDSEKENKKQLKNVSIDGEPIDMSGKGIVTKRERKEYEKLMKIKENMPYIKNLKDAKDKFRKQLSKLMQEKKLREKLGEISKNSKEAKNKIAKYQKRYEEVIKELKNDKLEAYKKVSLEAEKAAITQEMTKEQDKIKHYDDSLKQGLEQTRSFKALSQDELDKKIADKKYILSTIDLAAVKLLKGDKIEQICMKLENRDFKDKSGKLKENIEGHKEDTSKSDGLSEEHEEDTSKNDGLSEEEKLEEARKAKIENFKMNIPEEDNKLPSVSEEKHPIRKRIKDFLVGIKDKILNRNKKNNNPEEIKDEKPEEIKDEKPEEIKDEKPEETNKPWELPTEVKNKLVEEIAINGLNSETVRNVRESQSKEDGMQK